MSMKNFLALAAAMFAVTFSSCSDDLIEKAPVTTNIETKSGEEGAYDSFFPYDPVDYVSAPLVYVDGLNFYRAEIRFNDYEVPDNCIPEIHGYYPNREALAIGEKNHEYEKFGITCVTNYVSNHTIAYELRDIPDSGYLVIHTIAHHNNGKVYDRYIEVSLGNY